ncbi:TniQ family protein [Marinobacter sp.]|uniref:TniQ family protein n=1 Tax=Marinobacter sp. TaxID=50741 RepID=UPI002357BD8C|nr:TniQ family protein [Marinobacter sp.]
MHHKEYLRCHPRSKVRCLDILGIDGDIESLTSFVGRLAWHHSIKPSVLVCELIDPGKSPGFCNLEIASGFNSMTLKTGKIIGRVAAITGEPIDTVASMTFFHLHDQIEPSARGLISHTKKYCPQCYCEDVSSACRYDRLAWSLQGVTHCKKHNCLLLDKCTHCNASQPYLSTKCEIGFCHYCEQALFSAYPKHESVSGLEKSEVWASLVRSDFDLENGYHSDSIQVVLNEVARQFYPLSVGAFADFVNSDRHSAMGWLSGEMKPALISIQRVFDRLEIPWTNVLTGRLNLKEIVEMTQKAISREGVIERAVLRKENPRVRDQDEPDVCMLPAKRKRNAALSQKIDRYLDQIIGGSVEPTSRARIAAQFCVSVGYLESLFYLKVKRISEIYNHHLAERSDRRLDALRSEFIASLKVTYQAGNPPTWKNVCQHFHEDMLKRYTKTEISNVRKEILPKFFLFYRRDKAELAESY